MRACWTSLVAMVGICAWAGAAEVVAVQALTERVVTLHFKEGRVEHHRRGEPRSQERVILNPPPPFADTT